MKKRLYNIFQLIFILLHINFVFSQVSADNSAIRLRAVATENTIVLRWAITPVNAWKYSNKYGYIIERKTIIRDKKIVSNPEVKLLTIVPIKTKPLKDWEAFTKKNDYAAIAAQAIYGDDFEVGVNQADDKSVVEMINLAQELEQRYSLSLYAADHDFEVAKYMGLAYVDKDVKKGERYLYTVKSAIPIEKYSVTSGSAYLGLEDYRPLPQPFETVGIFKDKTVILTWNAKMTENVYSSYVIERSADEGKTFKVITNPPLAYIRPKKEDRSFGRMTYLDTLPDNDTHFQYKIAGISFLGQKGPYSKLISGKGTNSLKYSPYIVEAKINEKANHLKLDWEFSKNGMNAIDYFEVLKSNSIKGIYTKVQTKIPKTKSNIILPLNKEPVSYYKIVAIGKDGSKKESFPKMVQLDDNTPPETPSLLKGTIDSLGVVRLSWKQNSEIDFEGYRVFRANLKDDEFTQITFETIPKSEIIDTVDLKTLNDKVYYKVRAFDKRLNPSEFSEVLVLKKPDMVPPSQPVFKSFNVKEGKVQLTWISSTSSDAVKTMLYRKEKGEENLWELLAEVPLSETTYTDEITVPLKEYLYTLLTVDDSGLESEPIEPLSVSIPDYLPKPKITHFKAKVVREERKIVLEWKYNENYVVEFVLYKSKNDDLPTMYKVFSKEINSFTDKELQVNSKYRYLLQAIFKSGAKTPLKEIKINY